MKNIFLSFCTLFAFFLKLEEKIKNISITGGLLELSICFFFFYFYYKNRKPIKTKCFHWLSILFTCCMLIGKTFSESGNFLLLYKTPFHLLLTVLFFIGYFSLFKIILSDVYTYCKKYRETFPYKKIKHILDTHPFLFTFVCLFLGYLLYMIAFYPAILSPDPSNQIKQFFHIKTKYLDSVIVASPNVYITNHHPVFHTLLLGGCTKIGLFFQNFNFGLFLYTFVQTLFLLCTLSYTMYYMKKLNTPYKIRVLVLLFYLFCPIFPFYAMATVKDTFFSCCTVFYTLGLFTLLKNKKYEKREFLLLFITVCFLILFRNNGIHVFLLSFPFLFLVCKNIWKKNLVFLLLCLTFYFGYTKVALPFFSIPKGSSREMLSIPFQQTARYVSNYEKEVTDKEKEAIDQILDYATLKERYKPNISDPVKETFHKYATKEDLKNYFIVWARMFCKHPLVYVEATIANTYGYFYPNTTNWYIYYAYDKRLKEAGFAYQYNDFNQLRESLSKYANAYKKIPVLGLTVNIGFAFFLLFTFFGFLLYEKKYTYLPVLAPSLALLLICFASPVNTYFRYAMPYIFCIPILFCITLSLMQKK